MLTRREFLAASAAITASTAFDASAQAPVSRSKPNILFILADDLGWGDLSCYGRPDYRTPVLDGLAAAGIRFKQAYANSSTCSPTRVALITGRYQNRLQVGLYDPLPGGAPAGLPPQHPTLPSLLGNAGYRTALVGKWHLGFLPDYSPLKSGYERFFGIFGGAADYFNHGSKSSDPLFEQEVPVDRAGYMTNLLGDRAVQTIEGYAGSKEPFLLSLHFTAPHWPWEGPDDEAESKRIKNLFHRDGGTQKTYMAMMQNLDSNIGRVLQALDVHGLSANTIVIFTSDNGGERFSNIWPFTGMKGELLEGGLRIPAIVRWPGRIAAGSVSEQVMISMDWMPTLLAAAGAQPDPTYPPDGDNLLPTLTGRGSPHPRKLFWRYYGGGQRAVRDRDWKYLQIAGNEFLFDIVQDPRERANLKDRRKDIFDRLKSDWEAWNSTMLPERTRPATYGNPGNFVADHYGVTNPK